MTSTTGARHIGHFPPTWTSSLAHFEHVHMCPHLYSNESMLPSQHIQQMPFLTLSQLEASFGKLSSITPCEPAERLRAAETSCLIDRCISSCISMQASSILCILFILCCILAMSILKSLMTSHSMPKR